MALVNGKILKGDVCPYKDKCGMMLNVCNGKGCPFLFSDEHFCDFSCAGARFYKLMDEVEQRDNADIE